MIASAMLVAMALSGLAHPVAEVLPDCRVMETCYPTRDRMVEDFARVMKALKQAAADLSQRPGGFLPALEYGLPVGPAADAAGWGKVRHILGRGVDGALVGGTPPDRETLAALLAYMQPLAHVLIEHVREAEWRAEREPRVQTGAIRHGTWSETPKEGHYSGEMHFPREGEPTPLGYVGVSGSGWPTMYEYYRPGDERGSPLCRAIQFGTKQAFYSFTCRLLDGSITIKHNDERWKVEFVREGEGRAAWFPAPPPHGGKTR